MPQRAALRHEGARRGRRGRRGAASLAAPPPALFTRFSVPVFFFNRGRSSTGVVLRGDCPA
eukprot:11186274-Lingulodinium_polyedra.AAC.1